MTDKKHSSHTSLRLPRELMEWLQEHAAEIDRSLSWVMKRALEQYRQRINGKDDLE